MHLFGLKKFLSISLRTPNDLVYGETNRYPLHLFSFVRCIRYWLKLTRMEHHRLPRKAYAMLCHFDDKRKHNWVSKIRLKLFENGFGYIWLNQGVENVDLFLEFFLEKGL